MPNLWVLWVLIAAVVLRWTAEGSVATQRGFAGFSSAQRVLLIGLDGFGGLYLENATAQLPNLRRLMEGGAFTMRARAQIPTWSAPNWSTILCGLTPPESGVFDNKWVPANTDPSNVTESTISPISGAGRIPETMWRVARQQWQGKRGSIAVAISWDWLEYLVEPELVDFYSSTKENDTLVAEAMVHFIETGRPTLMFTHFNDIDEAGHKHGWGGAEYYEAARRTDGYIGDLLTALSHTNALHDTLVIVTADHGGFRKTHGQSTQACLYVPAIFWGPGVVPTQDTVLRHHFVSNRDLAVTALHALGLRSGRWMSGRVLQELYARPVLN
eukprot:RCo018361